MDTPIETSPYADRVGSILRGITMPQGLVVIYTQTEHHVYLRVGHPQPTCNVTGKVMSPWFGRKWMLSRHMTDGEIVQTAFLATLTAIEHEVREQFRYKGVAVMDPHYDIDKLVALRAQPDAIKERDHHA